MELVIIDHVNDCLPISQFVDRLFDRCLKVAPPRRSCWVYWCSWRAKEVNRQRGLRSRRLVSPTDVEHDMIIQTQNQGHYYVLLARSTTEGLVFVVRQILNSVYWLRVVCHSCWTEFSTLTFRQRSAISFVIDDARSPSLRTAKFVGLPVITNTEHQRTISLL